MLNVTAVSRSLTSHSYMVDNFLKKISKIRMSYTNHCGATVGRTYSHCDSLPRSRRLNHCGEQIGGGYRGHC